MTCNTGRRISPWLAAVALLLGAAAPSRADIIVDDFQGALFTLTDATPSPQPPNPPNPTPVTGTRTTGNILGGSVDVILELTAMTPPSGDVDLNIGSGILDIVTGSGEAARTTLRYDGPGVGSFALNADFSDATAITTSFFSDAASTIDIIFFDAAGTLLTSIMNFALADTNNAPTPLTITLSAANQAALQTIVGRFEFVFDPVPSLDIGLNAPLVIVTPNAATPEPSTFALAGAGIAVLAVVNRRRSRRKSA